MHDKIRNYLDFKVTQGAYYPLARLPAAQLVMSDNGAAELAARKAKLLMLINGEKITDAAEYLAAHKEFMEKISATIPFVTESKSSYLGIWNAQISDILGEDCPLMGIIAMGGVPTFIKENIREFVAARKDVFLITTELPHVLQDNQDQKRKLWQQIQKIKSRATRSQTTENK